MTRSHDPRAASHDRSVGRSPRDCACAECKKRVGLTEQREGAMAADENQLPQRSEASLGSEEGSLVAMEAAMREEIRELHEQRAGAMMSEIVELQKERDLAVAKLRRLEMKVKDMEVEREKRRGSSGGGGDGRAELVALLRQTLLEEQLLSTDLKKKLQTAKKQNAALTQQFGNETSQQFGNGTSQQSPSRVRRHSHDGRAPSPQLPPTSKPPTPSSSLSPHTPTNGGQSPRYSPSVVHRRYKLAVVTNCDVSTQTSPENTDQSDRSSADTPAPPILEALKTARADIVRLQRERDKEKKKAASELQKREELRKESECLQLECGVLRESLAEFSRWVRGKLEGMEENMDIFRVIYSLHRSLSQEQSVLQEMQKKLRQAEQKVLQLDKSNRQLALAVSEAEENYQSSLSQIRVLEKQLSQRPSSSLLTPPPGPTYSSLQTNGRMFSSPQLHPRSSSSRSSPLTTHTPSQHTPHDIV